MSIKATMELKHRPRSGLALGGMGSGWFELRHDGRFYNWSIFNNAPYGTGPRLDERAEHALFFVVRCHVQGEQPRLRILQIPDRHDVGSLPSQLFSYPWLSGVARIDYEASFPFSTLRYSDPELPLAIEMEAFTPFIPHDVKNSSLPAAIFSFSIRSTATKPVEVELVGVFQNLIGHDVARKRFTGRYEKGAGWGLIEVGAERVDPAHDTWGTQAMVSLAEDSTYWIGWDHRHTFGERLIELPALPNVDDVAGRNYGKDEQTGEKLARGTMKNALAVSRRLKPRGSFDHTFVLAWHLPNRYAGTKNRDLPAGTPRRLEGYAYANHFQGAAEVGRYVAANLPDLAARTRQFHRDFFDSSAPPVVLDQVNSQLNTFVTSAWLTKDGNFGIQEGMTDDRSWGPLATVDVSLYGSVPVGALFPELEQATWRAHARLQRPNGEIGHGIDRNFGAIDTHEAVHSRLDLPSQFAVLALRSYFWTGDREYLGEMWPHVKNALEYVLRERDANGDLLPDMGGSMCSYDNFPMFGAASYVASLWLAALAHAVAAARAVGDEAAAARFAEVLAKARVAFEQKLWNGKYYRLYNDLGGPKGDVDEGCLTDQIIGEWSMRLAGLGGLFDRKRVRGALREVVRRNTRYWGLRNCAWPGDTFIRPVEPANWGDQGNTCWSGTELCFASLLMYEGLTDEAMVIIRDVDERYRRAGQYFDHQEFGGHYYRPMGAWAILNALLGLSVCEGRFVFAPRLPAANQKLFFAVPGGTGHYIRRASARQEVVTLAAASGVLEFSEIALGLHGKRAKVTVQGDGGTLPSEAYTVGVESGRALVRFAAPLRIPAGRQLRIAAR